MRKKPIEKPISPFRDLMRENHRSTRITEPLRKPADDYFTHVEKKLRRV